MENKKQNNEREKKKINLNIDAMNGKTDHREIIQKLLSQIHEINFHDLLNPPDGEKLKDKNYIYGVIKHLMETAETNKWNLCKRFGSIYIYNGECWKQCSEDDIKNFLGEVAINMGMRDYDVKFFEFKNKLLKQFESDAHLIMPEPDPDKIIINLNNGTFEFSPEEWKQREFNPDDFLTYQLPFDFDPKAEAQMFKEFLDKVLPEKDCQKILAEYMGYVFVKTTTLKLEKVLFLYGTGANGKSVFFDIVKALFGEHNTSEYSLEDLTDPKGYHRAMIGNKLVNYASEISGKLESSIFKQLTSGEPVSARLPYGKPFEITNYAKMIFNVNELPKNVEHTHAYFRRHLIIPFNVTIPEDKQDKRLAQKIIANELSGIFNWVLEGLVRLLDQEEFTDAKAVRKAQEEYETLSDSVKIFLEDEGYYKSHSGTGAIKPFKLLYEEYKQYCLDGSYFKCSSRTFGDRLRNSGYKVERRNYGNVVYVEKKVVAEPTLTSPASPASSLPF